MGGPLAGGLVNDRLDGRASALAELYDPDWGTWSATGQMRGARWGHTATLLADGKVLVAGGYDDARRPLDTAELYDPDNGRWASTGRLTTGRGGHAATPLANGKVVVTGGGEEDTTTDLVRSATAEVYDPADGTWAKIDTWSKRVADIPRHRSPTGRCSSQAAAPPPPSVTTRVLAMDRDRKHDREPMGT